MSENLDHLAHLLSGYWHTQAIFEHQMTNSELQVYRQQLLTLHNRLDADESDLVVKGWWRSSRGEQAPLVHLPL